MIFYNHRVHIWYCFHD